MPDSRRGFGVLGSISRDVLRAAAQLAESLGYHSFWVNSHGNALEALAEAASVTSTIKLGVGVLPLSSQPASQILQQIRSLDGSGGGVARLPLDRLWLGVGSGAGGAGSMQRVRDGLEILNREANTTIFISALGPKMSRLAGEAADGVLFNWLTPEFALIANEWVREGARKAHREAPVLASYVRISLGEAGATRLAQEANRYGGIPQYADHFKRMGVEPVETGIRGETVEQIQGGLERWNGVLDEVVVRSITPNDTLEETLALVRAGAPRR